MSVDVACTHCGKIHKADRRVLGQTARCRTCAQPFVAEELVMAVPAPFPVQIDGDTSIFTPASRARSGRHFLWSGLLVMLGIAIAIVGLWLLGWLRRDVSGMPGLTPQQGTVYTSPESGPVSVLKMSTWGLDDAQKAVVRYLCTRANDPAHTSIVEMTSAVKPSPDDRPWGIEPTDRLIRASIRQPDSNGNLRIGDSYFVVSQSGKVEAAEATYMRRESLSSYFWKLKRMEEVRSRRGRPNPPPDQPLLEALHQLAQ